MYIELFLLDNAVMDMLICRLAAALCSRRFRLGRAAAASAAGAAYAALAFLYPPLMSLPCKIAAGLGMALALPFGGWRDYAVGVLATFGAAFMIGGAAIALALATGGGAENGVLLATVELRIAMLAALLASLFPSLARRLKRGARAGFGTLVVAYRGARWELSAMVDSGSTLCEPVSGKPVVAAYIPELSNAANIPVPVKTVCGGELLMAIRPDSVSFDGAELDALVALTKAPTHPRGLVPPAALPLQINTKSNP